MLPDPEPDDDEAAAEEEEEEEEPEEGFLVSGIEVGRGLVLLSTRILGMVPQLIPQKDQDEKEAGGCGFLSKSKKFP